MNSNVNSLAKPATQFRILAGLIIIATGIVLIARNLNLAYFPDWLFDWYTVFIVAGLYIGAKSEFNNFLWIVFVFIGSTFMLTRVMPGVNVWGFMWPLALIGLGSWYLLRNRKPAIAIEDQPEFKTPAFDKQEYAKDDDPSSYTATGDDYLDNVTVLCNLKRTVISKDFKGGDIVGFMGNMKLNLAQADIQEPVVIDITQTMSKTKITVPSDWRVVIDVDSIMSDFDDKRLSKFGTTPGKVLILKGTSVMSKLEVKTEGFK
jgi:predicted membrane protein